MNTAAVASKVHAEGTDHLPEGEAPVVEEVSIGRVQRDGMREVGDGALIVPTAVPGDASVVVGIAVLRVHLQGLSVVLHSTLILSYLYCHQHCLSKHVNVLPFSWGPAVMDACADHRRQQQHCHEAVHDSAAEASSVSDNLKAVRSVSWSTSLAQAETLSHEKPLLKRALKC